MAETLQPTPGMGGLGARLNERFASLARGEGVSGMWGISVSGSAARLEKPVRINRRTFDGTVDVIISSLYAPNGSEALRVDAAERQSLPLVVKAGAAGKPVQIVSEAAALHLRSERGMLVSSAGMMHLKTDSTLLFSTDSSTLHLDISELTKQRALRLPDADVRIPKGTLVTLQDDSLFEGTRTFANPIIVRGSFNVDGTQVNSQNLGFYPAALGSRKGSTGNPVNTIALVAKTRADLSVALTVDTQGYLWGYHNDGKKPALFSSKVQKADGWTQPRTLTFGGDLKGRLDWDGSKSTSVSIELSPTGVKAGLYNETGTTITPLRFDDKGRLIDTGSPVMINVGWQAIRNKPNTLREYGIVDAIASFGPVTHSGNWRLTNPSDASSLSSGALVLEGGLAVGKSLRVGATATFLGTVVFQGSVIQLEATKGLIVEDPVVTTGGALPPAIDDMYDRGLEFNWHDGANPHIGFIGFRRETNRFALISQASRRDGTYSGRAGTLEANVVGNLIGNAATATQLQAARRLKFSGDVWGEASFDGSKDAVIELTMPDSGVTPGVHMFTTQALALDVDASGRIRKIYEAGAITPEWSDVRGRPEDLTDSSWKQALATIDRLKAEVDDLKSMLQAVTGRSGAT